MKEIRKMSDEVLIKTLKEIREEIERRRAEVWEKYTGVKYPLKRNLRKEVNCGERK